jgi:hypothetical protein
MPGPNFVLDKGFLAETAVPQFYCVKVGTVSQSCTIATASGDFILGVAQEACDATDAGLGRIINVRLLGISRCVAQAAISRGARVRAHSSGKVTGLAGAAGTSENVVGIAMTASAADLDHIDVLLTPGVTINTAVS